MAWAPSYCARQELKAYLRVEDDLDDMQVDLAIAAASRAVDNTCQRQFGVVDSPIARVFTARVERGRSVIDINDLSTDAGLVVQTDSTGDGSYATTVTPSCAGLPRNALADGTPFTRIVSSVALPLAQDAVRVMGVWGWAAVPDTIKQATLLQASRLLARRDSPYGVTGSPDNGGELRLLARVDPDVAVTLRPYQRRWYAC